MKNRPTHKKHNCVKNHKQLQCIPAQTGGYNTSVQSVTESTCSIASPDKHWAAPHGC